MNVAHLASLLGVALLAAPAAPAADFRVSGPYTHDNLSIFLIHGAKSTTGGKLLTLQEAMEQKKVVVYETGSVNELAIENLSSQDVYIQSGDIVKGGRQDRVIPTDYILTSHSGRLPISSFCVEHGRWTKRGDESAAQFDSSTQMVAFKSLKSAVREKNGQAKVWQEVSNAQVSLASANAFAAPAASPTSMQLTLENRQLAAAMDAYVRDLAKIVDGRADAIGFAYAINGKISGGDTYAASELFRKMWPKLLRSSATEAVAEREKVKSFATPDAAAVSRALSDAERGREVRTEAAGILMFRQKESDKTVVFETKDRNTKDEYLHRNYMVK
jgi:hypothetical protein